MDHVVITTRADCTPLFLTSNAHDRGRIHAEVVLGQLACDIRAKPGLSWQRKGFQRLKRVHFQLPCFSGLLLDLIAEVFQTSLHW